MEERKRDIGTRSSSKTRAQERVNLRSYHALIISVQNYADPGIDDLKTPLNDGKTFGELLVNRCGFLPKNVKWICKGSQTTWERIDHYLRHYIDELTDKDSLIIYFAGHGEQDEKTDAGYWLPSDAVKSKRQTYYKNSDLRDIIKQIKARHVAVISDSCFSGRLLRSGDSIPNPPQGSTWLSDASLHRSRMALTSGNDHPVSDEGAAGQSIFNLRLTDYIRTGKERAFTLGQAAFTIQNRIKNQRVCYGPLPDLAHDNGELVLFRSTKSSSQKRKADSSKNAEANSARNPSSPPRSRFSCPGCSRKIDLLKSPRNTSRIRCFSCNKIVLIDSREVDATVGDVQIGDLIDWQIDGLEMFPEPRKVLEIKNLGDEQFYFVAGTSTGIPASQTKAYLPKEKAILKEPNAIGVSFSSQETTCCLGNATSNTPTVIRQAGIEEGSGNWPYHQLLNVPPLHVFDYKPVIQNFQDYLSKIIPSRKAGETNSVFAVSNRLQTYGKFAFRLAAEQSGLGRARIISHCSAIAIEFCKHSPATNENKWVAVYFDGDVLDCAIAEYNVDEEVRFVEILSTRSKIVPRGDKKSLIAVSELVQECMADANIMKVDHVIVGGAACDLPQVDFSLIDLKSAPVSWMGTSALGAKYLADLLAGNNKDFLLLDCSPSSYQIETMNGFVPVIESNTAIPSRKISRVSGDSSSKEKRVRIFEGIDQACSHYLGELDCSTFLKDFDETSCLLKVDLGFDDVIFRLKPESKKGDKEIRLSLFESFRNSRCQRIPDKNPTGINVEKQSTTLDELHPIRKEQAAQTLDGNLTNSEERLEQQDPVPPVDGNSQSHSVGHHSQSVAPKSPKTSSLNKPLWFILLVPLLFFGFLGAAIYFGGKYAAHDEANSLQGKWRFIAVTNSDGRKVLPESPTSTLSIDENKWQLWDDSDEPYTGEIIRVDYSKNPCQIDFVLYDDVLKGIFQLRGNKLKLCLNLYDDDPPRPVRFEANRNYQILEFVRIEK